jgi:anaerobic selenocysteine-containing dehydrogenase
MTEKIVRTICHDCHCKCGILLHVEGNTIVRVEGDPNHPVSQGMVCCKGLSVQQIHAHPDRLKYPLRRKGPRGANKWKEISWDDAMDEIETKIRGITKKYGEGAFIIGQGTGRGSNHWHMRANASFGLPGWGLVPTHVCLMPNLLPTMFTYGYFAFIDSADVRNANTIVEWGINPFTAWPGLQGPQLLDAKARGAKLIVIDPRFTDLAAKADIWLQIRPGTDGALALGMMNVLIEEGLYDKEFVDKWTLGFDELAKRVKEFTPAQVSEITWIPEEKIIAASRLMGTNRPTTATTSLGVCMHSNGMQNGRAIACLFGILGDLDAKGGLLSNRFWDVMLAPEITKMDPARAATLLGDETKPLLTRVGGAPWPDSVWRAITTGKPFPVKGMGFVADDAVMCYENSRDVVAAMSELEFIFVKDYFMTDTAKMADLVLPTAHWSERDSSDEELYSDPCPVVIPQKAVEPPGEAWCDWQFWLELGKRFKPEWWPWKNVHEMWQWRLKTFYGIDLSWEEMAKQGYFVTYGGDKRVYQKYAKGLERPDGQPGFRTASGRIELVCKGWGEFGYDPLPDYKSPSAYENEQLMEAYPFILMTGGRIYPFYHSAWTQIPMQREIEPEPYIEIHPDAAKGLNISDGEWLFIESPNGRIRAKARLTKSIDPRVVHLPRPGWRDACKELGLKGYGNLGANNNVLIGAEPSDPQFGTPAMRSSRCRLIKMEAV